MISLYGLFIFLLTAEAIHAQGNTNEGDDVDHASGSKDATSLPLGTTLQLYPRPYREVTHRIKRVHLHLQIFNQERSVKVDTGYEKHPVHVRSNNHNRNRSPSTSHDPHQSNEMPPPIRIKKSEEILYNQIWKTDQYDAFIEEETQYFELEYTPERLLGQGGYGKVFLATRTSNGAKVAYKSIEKSNVDGYTLETSPPPRCHLSNPLVGSEEKSAAQCMSSRPPRLMIPYESMIQMYLSRPGRHNPYVPEVTDYIVLEEEYIVVMEYVGEGWATLSSYMDDNGRPGIVDAREIIKTILDAVLFLRQQGVMHDDLHDENVMYNEQTGKVKWLDLGMSRILSGWEEEKSLPSKLSDSPSADSQSKAEIEETPKYASAWKVDIQYHKWEAFLYRRFGLWKSFKETYIA
ncbi:hypothetical protein BASA50_010464 [Batrachochytrium salamandrivorans]|uniref:non-specific serine/threonine protein kinase n=1 Tax=Batrachochytrium salamandrivorans TaxID=1357716 RepID=A0ABQ8EZJ0_9FUNG|nr:hypothetical protein BASA50_010464 [Batrachochytrium salamandrivorans]